MSGKLEKILQKDILSLMLKDQQSIYSLQPVIDSSLFSTAAYRFLCKRIFEHIQEFEGELPSKKSILIDIKKYIKDEETQSAYRNQIIPLFEREVESPKHLIKEVGEWAEKQQFGKLLEQAASLGFEGEVDKAKNLIKSSFLFDISRLDFNVHSVFEEWKNRQRTRKDTFLDTKPKLLKMGFGPFDERAIIAANNPTLALIMGTSGVGKSIFSVNFGYFAVNSGFKVAHFVFENTEKQTLARYDSRFVRYPYHLLKNYSWNKTDLAVANHLMRNLRRLRQGYLKVIHAPIETVTVADIEGLLKTIQIREGWIPDMIIYDSGDHLLPSKHQESFRLGVKRVYTDIKRQTEIRDIPILCTTHAKASSRGTRLRQESFSESYDKARLSDIVITISQTQEQEDDRQAELWLDKNRDEEGKIGILVDLLFRIMTIKFIEVVETRREGSNAN